MHVVIFSHKLKIILYTYTEIILFNLNSKNTGMFHRSTMRLWIQLVYKHLLQLPKDQTAHGFCV